MTLLFFDVLNAFLASSCIFVQRRKYLWWRDVKICLQNGSATRKSQVGWSVTFCRKEQNAASFCRSCFKYGVGSLNIQHFHNYCSYKNLTLTLEQLTCISMEISPSIYCTNTNMLHGQKNSLTGQLQHAFERILHIDAIFLRNKNKWRHVNISTLTKWVNRTSKIRNVLHSVRSFFPQVSKMKKAFMSLCHLTPPELCRVHTIVFYRKSEFRLYTFNIEFMYDNLNFSFYYENIFYIL